MTEAALQQRVVYRARKYGWMVAHFGRARSGAGGVWRTPGPRGYPDLTLARAGATLFVELKRELGKVDPEQEAWLAALGGVVWRPSDLRLGRVEDALR